MELPPDTRGEPKRLVRQRWTSSFPRMRGGNRQSSKAIDLIAAGPTRGRGEPVVVKSDRPYSCRPYTGRDEPKLKVSRPLINEQALHR